MREQALIRDRSLSAAALGICGKISDSNRHEQDVREFSAADEHGNLKPPKRLLLSLPGPAYDTKFWLKNLHFAIQMSRHPRFSTWKPFYA
jgi:hypothetical protein